MKKEEEKGFTLVELLAVIVILTIILAIAIPGISGIINSSTGASFEDDAKMLLTAISYKLLEDNTFDPTTVNETNLSNLNLSNENYDNLQIGLIDNKLYILVVGKNKWNGLKACGTRHSINIVAATDTITCENLTVTESDYNVTKGVNKPKLVAGMTPIKWNGTDWITTTEADTNWYNYTTVDKKWANAKTADGSMWVWIPRYIYKISSGWHCNGITCNGITNDAGIIDVQFSIGIDDTRDGSVTLTSTGSATDSNGTWTNHPAFTFGTTELFGMWVAKFEASAPTDNICYITPSEANCNVTTIMPNFIPNVIAMGYTYIGNQFTTVRNMEADNKYGWGTTGIGIDTHMLKLSEWGAAVYLAKSIYGKNTEVWINNSMTGMTGCAGNSASEPAYSGCQNTYNTTNGQQASTTGNIYGIYDMSGGLWERVSAYLNNGNSALTTYGSSIISADNKYKDVYTNGTTDNRISNYALAINHKGDAIYKTSNGVGESNSWYGDYTYLPFATVPWFAFGGTYGSTTSVGTFSMSSITGNLSSHEGFRAAIIVDEGL